MTELIDLRAYPVNTVLSLLLEDKTTGKNIIFATDAYSAVNPDITETTQITEVLLLGMRACDIQPRVMKSSAEQAVRTKKKAEVFTPAWICNKMNNYSDADWFERENVFNVETQNDWEPTTKSIDFPTAKTWKCYVDTTHLEITCGEAPFIVSRYDASTGEPIPIEKRIGILDRKLRVINENARTQDEWFKYVYRAYRSVYGFEFQGDNLLIARINLLLTFYDYVRYRWNCDPDIKQLKKISDIICWNFWQMDGLQGTVPNGALYAPEQDFEQISFFDFAAEEKSEDEKAIECMIYDWNEKRNVKYNDLKRGDKNMKFDYVIGNPPYQETENTYNRQEPIYPYFYDIAKSLSKKYLLITPARFLFNAGLTSKEWNKIMLSDEHLKVEYFNQNSSEIFDNTDIKGGVAIVYRDENKIFGAINEFLPDENFRRIARHFRKDEKSNLPSIMFGGRSTLKFNDEFLKTYPETIKARLNAIQMKHPEVSALGPNEEYELKSPTFEVLDFVFKEDEPDSTNDYYKLFGLYKGKRVYRYIEKKFMTPRYLNNNINGYKIYIPKASGNGVFGEIISSPVIAGKDESSTPSFISIGNFDTEKEAYNAIKYIKTKLARTLLGFLKITQDIVPSKWAYVPLQDFTENSDIDWSVSIANIDKQLYKKYGLTEEEIKFIETHVKEME